MHHASIGAQFGKPFRVRLETFRVGLISKLTGLTSLGHLAKTLKSAEVFSWPSFGWVGRAVSICIRCFEGLGRSSR